MLLGTLVEVSAKHLMEMVSSSNLHSSEVQDLIDVLLNKQGGSNQWKKVSILNALFSFFILCRFIYLFVSLK